MVVLQAPRLRPHTWVLADEDKERGSGQDRPFVLLLPMDPAPQVQRRSASGHYRAPLYLTRQLLVFRRTSVSHRDQIGGDIRSRTVRQRDTRDPFLNRCDDLQGRLPPGPPGVRILLQPRPFQSVALKCGGHEFRRLPFLGRPGESRAKVVAQHRQTLHHLARGVDIADHLPVDLQIRILFAHALLHSAAASNDAPAIVPEITAGKFFGNQFASFRLPSLHTKDTTLPFLRRIGKMRPSAFLIFHYYVIFISSNLTAHSPRFILSQEEFTALRSLPF